MRSSKEGVIALTLTLSAMQVACTGDEKPEQPVPIQPTATAPATTPPAPPAAPSTMKEERPSSGVAQITLTAASGSNVQGSIRVEQRNDGAWFTGNVMGLSPGMHGIHVHEKGDCSAADASSAGSHFAPTHAAHGAPTDAEHHAGDMGNIEADADGTAIIAILAKGVTLSGERGVEGRALIIHGGADDLTTQPSGNSGPPVACGVIRPQ